MSSLIPFLMPLSDCSVMPAFDADPLKLITECFQCNLSHGADEMPHRCPLTYPRIHLRSSVLWGTVSNACLHTLLAAPRPTHSSRVEKIEKVRCFTNNLFLEFIFKLDCPLPVGLPAQ